MTRALATRNQLLPSAAAVYWPHVSPAKVLGCLLALGSLLLPELAAAQSKLEGQFSAQRFHPAPGPRNLFSTRSARVGEGSTFSFGLMADYAQTPFVVRSCTSTTPGRVTDCGSPDIEEIDINVVENLATGSLLGSYNPIERLQLGLVVPLVYVEGDGITLDGLPDYDNGIEAVAMGDAEFEVKGRIIGELKSPFTAGAAAFVSAPLGKATADGDYVGNDTPAVGFRGIADLVQGRFSLVANLNYTFRGEGRVGKTKVGSEFGYNIGAGYFLSPVLRVAAEAYGATRFSSTSGENSMELDGGLQIFPGAGSLGLNVGAGFGLVQGVGVPSFRVLAGFIYSFESADRDGDGFDDDVDQCPTVAEDVDQFEDTDGCPDSDNDGDTIKDGADKCPNDPEDPDGFEDIDGCAEADNDRDNILDSSDACPLEAETRNGYKDEDGCPDVPDSDEDGVKDEEDQCPKDVEDTDGFEDTDGCPDLDNDADGLSDANDECVDEAETKNGYQDEDGCPDKAPQKKPAAPKKTP